ncbi:hypothetical protein [Peribacillus frigoritolerans]|uniref:hypothetical protein n=1 Tax=Peribacillus frigoritolerans TaxID=450367 RepID=UPI0010715389|nr:hypothetical protein [Peribacillus frigoritolerans]TFH59643.1 hypothetical protein E4J71_19695 [Peribacillus frigoritolerans]
MSNLETPVNENVEENQEKITRSMAGQYVISRLNVMNKDITAFKGNKASGSGVVIQSKNNPNNELKAKFYNSKSHLEHVPSWHTVGQKDISNDQIDLHIFTVSYNQDFYTFFLTKDEL